ncbi:MAG: flagellar basal body rod protein FlgC, partial [Marinovum sp.]|nr:flagellar basal body rod protein FlgC [Marinovum sp.]
MTGVKNIFDVVGRSMGAQMVRLNTIASNIANMESKASSAEEAY